MVKNKRDELTTTHQWIICTSLSSTSFSVSNTIEENAREKNYNIRPNEKTNDLFCRVRTLSQLNIGKELYSENHYGDSFVLLFQFWHGIKNANPIDEHVPGNEFTHTLCSMLIAHRQIGKCQRPDHIVFFLLLFLHLLSMRIRKFSLRCKVTKCKCSWE